MGSLIIGGIIFTWECNKYAVLDGVADFGFLIHKSVIGSTLLGLFCSLVLW